MKRKPSKVRVQIHHAHVIINDLGSDAVDQPMALDPINGRATSGTVQGMLRAVLTHLSVCVGAKNIQQVTGPHLIRPGVDTRREWKPDTWLNEGISATIITVPDRCAQRDRAMGLALAVRKLMQAQAWAREAAEPGNDHLRPEWIAQAIDAAADGAALAYWYGAANGTPLGKAVSSHRQHADAPKRITPQQRRQVKAAFVDALRREESAAKREGRKPKPRRAIAEEVADQMRGQGVDVEYKTVERTVQRPKRKAAGLTGHC
jgi:hypothetical protein